MRHVSDLSHDRLRSSSWPSAATWADPWPMYRALRDHDPVHHVVPRIRPDHDYYVLSRHADIFAAARDHQTFSSAQGLTVNYGELEMIGLADNPPMVMQDPPVHTEFRKLVSRGFTPRQVEAVEPKVREYVIERIERMRAERRRGHRGGTVQTAAVDGRRALPRRARGGPRPVRRLDRGDRRGQHRRGRDRRRARDARRRPGRDDGVLHRADRAPARRTRATTRCRIWSPPGVGADGDIAGVLSILAFTFTMVTGGNDTTTGMLGGSVQLLHQRPDQRGLLARTRP